ncbi:hypothetical protein BH23GEM10_BH23GEM10_00080 [soil metagenome]
MSTFDTERLLALLPAVYRVRDAELDRFRTDTTAADAGRGGPLEALLAIIAAEIAAVEENIAQLHDDQFIETCADSVVPYIADLVGHRALPVPSGAGFATPRAEVANAIAHRRRKGTAAILEQLARDVTGWPARLVEYFQLLATTQHLNHVRLQVRAPELRDVVALQRIGSPFDGVHRTLDVRRIGSGRGRYNIPSVGVTLWRLGTWDIEASMPRPHASASGTRFRFDPLGRDVQLFNPTRVEADPLGFAAETDLPDPLQRRTLARELEARRVALVNGDAVMRRFFAGRPPFAIAVAGAQIADDEVLICDLSSWSAAPASRSYRRADGTDVTRVIRAAVDPVLGRVVFPAAVAADSVRVSYTTAFAGGIGAGPYDRVASLAAWLDPVLRPVTWQIGVSRDAATLATSAPPHSAVVGSIAEAVSAWKTHAAANPGAFGVIAIMDSATYTGALTGTERIDVPAGARLALVAAGWPRFDDAGPGGPFRPTGGLTAQGLRPHMLGDVSICGTPAPGAADPDAPRRNPGELILDGLLVEGELRVLVGDLGRLDVRHCTLDGMGVNASVQPELQNGALHVAIERAIAARVTLPAPVPRLSLRNAIIDGDVTAPGAHAHIDAATVMGATTARALDASDALFVDVVTVERRQLGCIRYSHVPAGSMSPRRFRCQPDLAVEAAPGTSAATTARRVAPVFSSLDQGNAAYAQLARRCALEIRTGASNGSEMGAFQFLQQSLREANLRFRMHENLRVGLDAGISFRT